MKDTLLSVIVPVYNKESYIDRCLESILGQSYSNIEIILVDDGSVDASGDFCDRIAKRDDRVMAIHTENQGSMGARIKGFDSSNADYVTFVDADDWIDEDMYFELMQQIKACDVDFVSSGMHIEGEYKDLIIDGLEEGNYELSCNNTVLESLLWDYNRGKCGVMPSLCTKIFKRQFLEKSIHSIDRHITIGDDRALFYPAAVKAKSFRIIHKAYYHYRNVSNSLSHKNDVSCFNEIKYMWEYMKKAFEDSGVYPIVKDSFERNLRETLDIAERNVFGLSNENYVFPFGEIPKGCKLVIYGLGVVGKSYCRYLFGTNYAELVAVIDKTLAGTSFNGINVCGIDKLKNIEYDYVLIANFREEIAKSIQDDLVECRVEQNKIIWVKPIIV